MLRRWMNATGLVLVLCAVCACTPTRRGGGGGGGGDGDDDDSGGFEGFSEGTLPCELDPPQVDVWSVALSEGDSIRVRIDTVSAEDTFDPALSIYDADPLGDGVQIGDADDDFECTYPPLEYECPEYEGEVGAAGTYYGLVTCLGDNVASIGRYRADVWVNGVAVDPTLEHDDIAWSAGVDGGEDGDDG